MVRGEIPRRLGSLGTRHETDERAGPVTTADPGRCSAHVLDDDGRLSGCPDPAAGETRAHGTRANDGRALRVALCAEHLALVEAGQAMTLTLALGVDVDE
jgi:hypothetical protein